MEDKIITFQTFDNPNLAHIIRAKLETNDIPCFLSDEHIIGLNPLYNLAVGGVKLKIFERDYEKYILLLSEVESFDPDDFETSDSESFHCLQCNSTNVSFGNATKRRFGIFTLIVSFLFMVYPFRSRKVWHCYDCGHEFDKVNE